MTTASNSAPESALSGLNRRLRTLLSAATVIAHDSGRREIAREILSFYRQMAIAELFDDRFIVAVAGLQGAGKTTIIRELYGIPKEYLPEYEGRGEKLPVVISEHPAEHGMQAFVKRTVGDEQNGYHFTDEELTPEEFCRTAEQPGEFDLWLELKVPERHFHRPDRALVLLPGIEEAEDQKGKDWQLFMHHALTVATTCLMVFNQTKFAQGNNLALIERLAHDFKAAKPLMALAFSDQRSAEQNAQFRQQVIERFGVPEHEAERVILTGVGTKSPTGWVDQLVRAIVKYSMIPREYRRNQMHHMQQLLAEFAATMGKIQDELNVYDQTTEAAADKDYFQQMRIFDSARASLRRKVAKQVHEAVLAHQAATVAQVQDLIAARSGWQQLKRTILGSSFEEHLAFTRAVQATWDRPAPEAKPATSGEEQSTLKLSLTVNQRLEAIARERLEAFAYPLIASANPPGIADDVPQGHAPELTVRQEVLDNLNGFFLIPSDDPAAVPALMEQSIRLIPLIVLGRLNLALIASGAGVTEKDGQLVVPHISAELTEQFKSVTLPSRSIINGIAVVFGLDAVDGTIDTIPALLKAIGLPATGAATSISVAAAGLVSLVYVAGQVSRQIAKQDFKDEDAAVVLVRHYAETYEQRIMEHLDDLMLDARDHLEQRIAQRLHKSKAFERWEALRQALRNVQDHSQTLEERLRGAAGVLG